MRDTRRRLALFSFYDRTGIEAYLERQAEEGWLLEKMSAFAWRYRRIEPRKIHFAVTYFPKASAFDPEPSEGQVTFQEFCEHAGWKLASSNAQIQVFYNEQEDPTPIETDALMEVEQIHESAKRSFLPSYMLLVFVGLLQLALYGYRIATAPLDMLTSNLNLFGGLCWIFMMVLCAMEIGGYYHWRRRALAAARLDGSFVETASHKSIQIVILFAVLAAFALLIMSTSANGTALVALSSIAVVLGLTALIVGLSELLKKAKLSASANRTITIAVTIIASFGFAGLIIIAVVGNVGSLLPNEEPVETYEFRGMTLEIHHDELPLTIEDLIETDYDSYSYEIRNETSSLLASRINAVQRPRMDALEQPDLTYSVITAKAPFTQGLFRDFALDDFAHNYGRPDPEDSTWEEHVAIDPAPWGAVEAYQLYLGGEAQMRFLLCYGRNVVEIGFPFDWELTDAQMGIVGEKLGGYEA